MLATIMNKINLIILFFFLCYSALADPSGIPGLGKAMTIITVIICGVLINGSALIALIVSKALNYKSQDKKNNIILPFLSALILSGFVFWVHGIGDLTYSTGYIILIILSAFVGAIIGYKINPKQN